MEREHIEGGERSDHLRDDGEDDSEEADDGVAPCLTCKRAAQASSVTARQPRSHCFTVLQVVLRIKSIKSGKIGLDEAAGPGATESKMRQLDATQFFWEIADAVEQMTR